MIVSLLMFLLQIPPVSPALSCSKNRITVVKDVDRKLNELTVIEQNDWKEIQIVPAKQVIKQETTLKF